MTRDIKVSARFSWQIKMKQDGVAFWTYMPNIHCKFFCATAQVLTKYTLQGSDSPQTIFDAITLLYDKPEILHGTFGQTEDNKKNSNYRKIS